MFFIAESAMISATTVCTQSAQTARALLQGHDMRNLLSIALCLPLAACVIGEENGGSTGGGDDDTQGGTNNPNDGSITGLISQDTTWSGEVLIGYDRATTRIEPNVTVTVSPGTVIKFKEGASLDIKGKFLVQGTSAQKVRIEAAGQNGYALLLSGAPATGTLELTYAVMTRGAIQTNPGSTTKITDTKMYRASGDLLVLSGGTITMDYSQIGPAPGETESTHCNIHTSGNANTISIRHSDINGAPFGMMLYGGLNTIFTDNNWYSNMKDIATDGTNVSADITGSWFAGGAPTSGNGATYTGVAAAAKITGTGVRP
jgi:hypothetical protein